MLVDVRESAWFLSEPLRKKECPDCRVGFETRSRSKVRCDVCQHARRRKKDEEKRIASRKK
jgi:hypothetical protein